MDRKSVRDRAIVAFAIVAVILAVVVGYHEITLSRPQVVKTMNGTRMSPKLYEMAHPIRKGEAPANQAPPGTAGGPPGLQPPSGGGP